MPLGKNVQANVAELKRDKRKGKEKGANGKARSFKQILAIAYDAVGHNQVKPL